MGTLPLIPEPDNFTTFGDLLRFLRETVHLTQREFAQRVGYHYSYISRIEKNERVPDTATLVTLFIPVLQLEDEPAWTTRLLELADAKPLKPTRTALPSQPTLDSATPSPGLPAYPPLPVSLNPLLGREQEVDALSALLTESDSRLITIIGAPGVGKTRLALHVANQLQDRFSHGALFIDLTKVSQPNEVLPAIQTALGLSEASEVQQMQARIVNALKQKNILLILDNFEHVLSAASEFVQLLGNAAQVRALVTSREALNIPGEQEFPVHPLPLPQESDDALETAPTIQLFLQRARAAQPNFQLTTENKHAVVEICRRLDGLPLAIELAAPRIKALTPQAMLRQFERRLDWDARSAQFTRQTLRGAIEWSYNLLSESSQVLLRRLAVFSGGWTVDSAEVVCADLAESEASVFIHKDEVLNLLLQLLDKSIVVADHSASETRYRFLETIRDFAREKLTQSLEEEDVRNRHVLYCAKLAETVEQQLEQPDRLEWMRRGEEEHSNIISALEWGLHHSAALNDSLRLMLSVNQLWLARGRFREGFMYSQQYIQPAQVSGQIAAHATLLFHSGAMADLMYEYATAYRLCEESVQVARSLNDKSLLAKALYHFGEACHLFGQYMQARTVLEECIALCKQLNDSAQLGRALCILGSACSSEGEYEQACGLIEEALTIAVKHNLRWNIAQASFSLGTIHRHHRSYNEAIPYFLRSLGPLVDVGDRNYEGYVCSNLSILYNVQNDYVESGRFAERAFLVFQSLGDGVQLPFPLRMLAYSAIHAGNLSRAWVLIRESLMGNRGLGHSVGQVACLVTLATYFISAHNPERAILICGLVETRMKADGFTLLEPDTKALRDVLEVGARSLPADAYQAAYAAGQVTDLDTFIVAFIAKESAQQ